MKPKSKAKLCAILRERKTRKLSAEVDAIIIELGRKLGLLTAIREEANQDR